MTYDGPDTDYSGREVCLGPAGFGGVLTIVDVTDKANPTLVSETLYPEPRSYAHQGWLTDDRRYFLMDDEGDESTSGINTRTLVFDVTDLDEPSFSFEYVAPTTSTDHNLFVHDGYVYQANYTAGLRILDLAEIDDGTLTEAAFFDTLPESDATGFDGAFGVYPFFESGIVVVSDMRRGLFVLQPRLGTATGLEPEVTPGEGASLAVYPNPLGAHAAVDLTSRRRSPSVSPCSTCSVGVWRRSTRARSRRARRIASRSTLPRCQSGCTSSVPWARRSRPRNRLRSCGNP